MEVPFGLVCPFFQWLLALVRFRFQGSVTRMFRFGLQGRGLSCPGPTPFQFQNQKPRSLASEDLGISPKSVSLARPPSAIDRNRPQILGNKLASTWASLLTTYSPLASIASLFEILVTMGKPRTLNPKPY